MRSFTAVFKNLTFSERGKESCPFSVTLDLKHQRVNIKLWIKEATFRNKYVHRFIYLSRLSIVKHLFFFPFVVTGSRYNSYVLYDLLSHSLWKAP